MNFLLDQVKEKGMQTNEDFLKSESKAARYTVFPLQYPDLYEYYDKHIADFWTKGDVRVKNDLVDWNEKMNDGERFFIENVLAFFASSDGIVNENLLLNFYNDTEISEVRQFYAVQMAIESVHNEAYSIFINEYVKDPKRKDQLFRAMETVPAVKEKVNWALKWINEGSSTINQIPKDTRDTISNLVSSDRLTDEEKKSLEWVTRPRASFAQRLVAFICVEGIFFSGSFCAIAWMKERKLLEGLGAVNQFISRDENMHCEFGIALYNKLPERLDEKTVHTIVNEAVEIETVFVTESLPVSLLGMNSNLMSEYIKYVADMWLYKLNYAPLYNIRRNPFPFMELLSLPSKEDFFSVETTNYSKPSAKDNTIEFDADF
jgi:ribonucleoside-diphosphate reductase beta chain